MGLLGITFARYVSVVVFPRMDDSADIDSDWRVKGVAIAAIVTVAFSNSFGLKGGAMLNTVLTGLKLVAVTGVIILGLSQVETGAHHFEEAFEVCDAPSWAKCFRVVSQEAFRKSCRTSCV